MRALVTGASGFIGKALTSKLIEDGNEITTTSRSSIAPNTGANHIQSDVTNVSSLHPLFEKRYDVIFHTAGKVAFDEKSTDELFRVNRDGVKNILSLAIRVPSLKKVVIVGSTAALGPAPNNGDIITEETPFSWNPSDHPYAASKFEGERIGLEYAHAGSPVVVVNPGFVIGEGDDHTPAMRLFQKLKHRKVPFYPPGGICAVWITDVVNGILAAADRGRTGERYILGGENITNRQAYKIIAREVGGLSPVMPLPKSFLFLFALAAEAEATIRQIPPRFTRAWALSAGHFHFFSSEKAKRELGYTFISFQELVDRTAKWMRDNQLL